jgi:hypothetical protein
MGTVLCRMSETGTFPNGDRAAVCTPWEFTASIGAPVRSA